MLSAKVNSVFNPEFQFDTDDTFFKQSNNKIYGFTQKSNNKKNKESEQIDEVTNKNLEDLIDNDDEENSQNNNEDKELESNDESKQELESLIKKKDLVRLKTQPTKVGKNFNNLKKEFYFK